ncbi:hypothetical protein V2J09_015774 [Rumex salicifolius]
MKMMKSGAAGKEEEYRRVFRHLDVDGDGKISAWELRRCMAGEMTEEEAEAAVRAADGDGKLGMEEFVRMMMAEEEDEESLKAAFKMYEEDEGRITSRSLKRMLSKLGEKKSVDECVAMISAFDLNGDGVLSFSEFKLMMS